MANEYAEDALARTEEAVQAALTEVKQSRSAFRAASAAKLQEQREKLEAERKTAEEIVHLCCPMNRRSEKKLYKRLESAKNYGGKYEPEDAVRAIMGGKLY